MKIIFMGTPEFAVASLEALVREHEVVACVTQPDKPQGRGNKVAFSPVKTAALRHNIDVLQPERIKRKAVIAELKRYEADVFVVAAYGQVLSESILTMPRYGCINVHGSLLPKYRGAAPIQWAILSAEKVTGVTIMRMDRGIDTGDMLLKRELPILPEDTGGSLHDKMAELGAEALLEAMSLIKAGNAVYEKQDDSSSCYAPMLSKETGRIDWNATSRDICNLVRGLDPWPAAYTTYNGGVLKIWKVEYEECTADVCAGTITSVDRSRGIVVKTKDAAVLITQLQQTGGKRMDAGAYLRGHNMNKGDKL